MGLGSENKEQRQRFEKVVKSHWRDRIKVPDDARRIITMIQQDPLHQMDSYSQRKIRELEIYIAISNPNENLKDFQKRMR